MTDKNVEALFKEFDRLVASGDEAAMRAFLVDHLKEFPKELQDKITFAFFAEAVTKQGAEASAVPEMQQEAGDALAMLLGARKELENEARIGELKEQLKP